MVNTDNKNKEDKKTKAFKSILKQLTNMENDIRCLRENILILVEEQNIDEGDY